MVFLVLLFKLDSLLFGHFLCFAGVMFFVLLFLGAQLSSLVIFFYSRSYEDGYYPYSDWFKVSSAFFDVVTHHFFLALRCVVTYMSTCISILWLVFFKCSISSSQTNLASSVVLLGFYMCVSGRLSINSARLSSNPWYIMADSWSVPLVLEVNVSPNNKGSKVAKFLAI